MKNNRISAIIFYFFVILVCILTIIAIFDAEKRGSWRAWLSLVLMWLALGNIYFNKSRNKVGGSDKDEK